MYLVHSWLKFVLKFTNKLECSEQVFSRKCRFLLLCFKTKFLVNLEDIAQINKFLPFYSKNIKNKKVLLRERKKHTANHIASACYAALSPDWGGVPHLRSRWRVSHPRSGWGYPIPGPGRGYPSQVQVGITPSQVQVGYPIPGPGWGYPIPSLDRVVPIPGPGPGLDGVPPHLRWGTPTWT